jgi:hypothetical protein
MSKGRYSVTESLVRRALRAAQKTGVVIRRLEVGRDSISLVVSGVAEKGEATDAADADNLDRELEDWRQRHGQA